jgi:hypothetical protein
MDLNVTLTPEGISIAFFAGLGIGLAATGLMIWRATCLQGDAPATSSYSATSASSNFSSSSTTSQRQDIPQQQTYTRVRAQNVEGSRSKLNS